MYYFSSTAAGDMLKLLKIKINLMQTGIAPSWPGSGGDHRLNSTELESVGLCSLLSDYSVL